MKFDSSTENCLKKISAKIKYDVINSIGTAGSGHPGGSLSSKDIITSLYFGKLDSGRNVMKYDPKKPDNPYRDRFVLSKGHACPALYSALSQAGFFPREELKNLRSFGSILQGHPDMNKTPGVDMSTGSLGQGLSVGVGMSIAAYIDNLDYRTYVVIGDGESQEGQITEAAKIASTLEIDNLCAILDYNKLQIDGCIENVCKINPKKEWSGYDWNVLTADGHDFSSILDALSVAEKTKNRPSIIIANTVKGKGISFMESDPQWHGKAPKNKDLETAINECKKDLANFSDINEQDYIKNHLVSLPQKDVLYLQKKYTPKKPNYSLEDKVATRVAFGDYIVELGKSNPEIVLITGDLTGSVNGTKFGLEHGVFSPKESTIEVSGKDMRCGRNGRLILGGIAEANMANMASGLASCGKYPIVATFDVFVGNKMNEQIRQGITYANLPAMFVGTHSGLGVEQDGATHQSIFAPIYMAHLHGMRCFQPADGNETVQCMDLAIRSKEPTYLRLTRQKLPILNTDHICKEGEGAYIAHKSPGSPEVAIVASGAMVHNAIIASNKLRFEKEIPSMVINVYDTDSAYNEDTLENILPKNVGLVAVHDGGKSLLRDLINHRLQEVNRTNALISLGIKDYGASGPQDALLEYYGLNSDSIVKAAQKVRMNQLKRK